MLLASPRFPELCICFSSYMRDARSVYLSVLLVQGADHRAAQVRIRIACTANDGYVDIYLYIHRYTFINGR